MDLSIEHETHIEATDSVNSIEPAEFADAAELAEASDAPAFLWVCACGDGEESMTRELALMDSRRHERLVG